MTAKDGVLKFPGRAGILQAAGLTRDLISELGDRYSDYHVFLKDQFQAMVRRPDPQDYPRDFAGMQAFAADWSKVLSIMQAETLLRQCRHVHVSGGPLDPIPDPDIPLLDENDELVDAEVFDRRAYRAPKWKARPKPDWAKG